MDNFKYLKAKFPDAILLFRIGDFYELLNKDAKDGADILGITLTWRNDSKPRNFTSYDGAQAMFPRYQLDTYLPKLIRAGKRVAICDQLEDPKLAKTRYSGITELISL